MKNGILYLSTLIPDEEFEKIIQFDKSPQIATHTFNWKVFKSIKNSKSFDYNLFVISFRPISEYPRSKIKFVKCKKWFTSYGILHELFFVNLPVIKSITIFASCLFKSIYWGMSTRNKKGVFISCTLPYLICGYIVSRCFNIKMIGIISDPPNMQYKISWEPTIKSKFRKLNGILNVLLIKKLSGVIALTKYLADDYCPGGKKLIMEGITEPSIHMIPSLKSENFIVMYAGSLLKVYGILELLNAFKSIHYNDLELWIFGKGDIEEQIIQYTKVDSRIKYFGVRENSEILYFESLATILINPRPTNLPDSKYSFPSKILEYMQSGKPTLITKLQGIPPEYDDFVFYLDGDDESSIAKGIKNLYEMDRSDLLLFGERSRKISESKSIEKQGQKMAEFIIDVIENKI